MIVCHYSRVNNIFKIVNLSLLLLLLYLKNITETFCRLTVELSDDVQTVATIQTTTRSAFKTLPYQTKTTLPVATSRLPIWKRCAVATAYRVIYFISRDRRRAHRHGRRTTDPSSQYTASRRCCVAVSSVHSTAHSQRNQPLNGVHGTINWRTTVTMTTVTIIQSTGPWRWVQRRLHASIYWQF